ncbi:MAG TPA: hypothetical protein DDX19_11630 [Rhodopirellula baltica]|nr:hypothetical protein [Rhodopirellula baltica]
MSAPSIGRVSSTDRIASRFANHDPLVRWLALQVDARAIDQLNAVAGFFAVVSGRRALLFPLDRFR